MTELENFVKMGLNVDEIRRNTGVSAHTLKSLAVVQLQKLGIKNLEYELLMRILTNQNEVRKFEELTPSEKAVVAKIVQGVGCLHTGSNDEGKVVQNLPDGFEEVRKSFGISPASLKSQLRQILAKLGVENIEYTLLCEVYKSAQNPDTTSENE